MTTDEKSLIEDLSRRAHFEWLYSRVAEDWKYGGTEDTSKKIHPRIRVYDNLPETVKADYRGVINETFNALRRCGARIQSLDVLESLYFIAACNTSPVSAHVATLFLQHDAVDQALLRTVHLTDRYHQSGDFSRAKISQVLLGLLGSDFSSANFDSEHISPYFSLMVWAIFRNMPDFAVYFWHTMPSFVLIVISFIFSILTNPGNEQTCYTAGSSCIRAL